MANREQVRGGTRGKELKGDHTYEKHLDESVLAAYYDRGDERWSDRALNHQTVASFDLGYDVAHSCPNAHLGVELTGTLSVGARSPGGGMNDSYVDSVAADRAGAVHADDLSPAGP